METVEIMRWPGKPTSGRFVYKSRRIEAWVWQCDLHYDDDEWGQQTTWLGALNESLEHAATCPYESSRRLGLTNPDIRVTVKI